MSIARLDNIPWRKSTYSNGQYNCVEVALSVDGVGVRDTKDRAGAALFIPASEWRAFLVGAQTGEFDLPG